MTLQNIWMAWQNFWFKPQSPLPVAVFRIVFGFIFVTGLTTQYFTDFFVFFGAHPIITHSDFVAWWLGKDAMINIFEYLPMEDSWHIGVFILMGTAAIMMTVGLYTRFSTFVTFILYTSISNQFPFMCNAGDDMQRLVLLLLIFSRAGDALSIDCILNKPKKDWPEALLMPPAVAPWGQRMMQLQISLAYVNTGLLKLNSDPWFSGNGLNYASRLIDFAKFNVPFLFDHRFSLYLLNWFTIVVELSLGTLVWISELTNWVLLSGVIFQLGIDWTMNIPIFEFVFLSMYALFIKPEHWLQLFKWFGLFFRFLRSKSKQLSENSRKAA